MSATILCIYKKRVKMANNLEFIPYSISNGQIVFDHIKGVDLWETTLSNNVYPPSTENYNTAVKNWEYSGTNYNPRPELTSLFKYNGQYITREIFSSCFNIFSTINHFIIFDIQNCYIICCLIFK